MAREVSIGLVGLGSVGTGVMKILDTHAEDIEGRLGARLVVRRVAVRQPKKRRAQTLPEGMITGQVDDVLSDPSVQIVVEVMGGVETAHRVVTAALEAGKHVVTANKALLAAHGEELFALASSRGLDLLYEAAVGGGIPIIRTLREALASDRITAISGILNGTTNFMLSEMADGRDFDTVLADAQARGFAEADPSADVDGHDAAQKLCLLAAIAFGTRIRAERVYTEGIRHLQVRDVTFAEEMGYTLKLLAVGRRHEDGSVELRVHPTLIPGDSLLANVGGAFNAVQVHSEALGPSAFIGQGAGSLPTGSAVVADLIDCARNLLLGTSGRVPHRSTHADRIKELAERPMTEVVTSNYLRFVVQDQPGVLGRITTILGDYGISIASFTQKERQAVNGGPVSVVTTTHEAREQAVRDAIGTIDRLPFVKEPTARIRIETEPPVVT